MSVPGVSKYVSKIQHLLNMVKVFNIDNKMKVFYAFAFGK